MARVGRLGASYILDWVIVICLAAGGAALTYISGFHRPFSLTDSAISYPLKSDIVSLPVVAIVSLVVPAILIAAFNLVAFQLDRSKLKGRETSATPRDRILVAAWDTHVGWLGLCVGLAATLFITAGLKDMVGKPRPNLLARCNPDLTDITKYVVGGFGMNLDSEAPPFVTSAICMQPDRRDLDDGFAAFPSGNSSFSSAGMIYLTLWLCARWGIAIPFSKSFRGQKALNGPKRIENAPPLWQVTIAFVPVIVMLFIASSRYADFHHAGFDIIAGMILGSLLGWASFRLYHRPLQQSAGHIAWDPRNASHAFLAYAGRESPKSDEEQNQRPLDTELEYLSTVPNRTSTTNTDGSQRAILADQGR